MVMAILRSWILRKEICVLLLKLSSITYIYIFIYHYIVYYNRYRYIDIPPYITKINVFKPPSKGSNSNESPFLGPEVTSRTSLLEPLEERLLVCRGAGFHGMVGWVDHSVIPGNQW